MEIILNVVRAIMISVFKIDLIVWKYTPSAVLSTSKASLK